MDQGHIVGIVAIVTIFGAPVLWVVFRGIKAVVVDPWLRRLEIKTAVVKEERQTEELRAQNLDKELKLAEMKLAILAKEEENLLLQSGLDKKVQDALDAPWQRQRDP